ncbi:MAG: electron transfer flavoprotein subunit beta/FixA family protein [Acidimicrobiia bacterium]
MRIVVCVKEVLDPDAIGNYALSGGLVIGDDGVSITLSTVPRLMNGYDEQAIEAALRLREAGVDATIGVVSVGTELTTMLRHAKALGADEVTAIEPPPGSLDGAAVAALLAAHVRASGGADLVLCGRQASDDDQGVVPALLGEALGAPVVTVARSIETAGGAGGEAAAVRVARVTPEGDEVVEVALPAVVTVSSELGEPRYPTMPMKMAARKVQPTVVTAADLGLDEATLAPRVAAVRQEVREVTGDCEIIEGADATEVAERLLARLIDDHVLQVGS